MGYLIILAVTFALGYIVYRSVRETQATHASRSDSPPLAGGSGGSDANEEDRNQQME
jgi:hypothetical protein